MTLLDIIPSVSTNGDLSRSPLHTALISNCHQWRHVVNNNNNNNLFCIAPYISGYKTCSEALKIQYVKYNRQKKFYKSYNTEFTYTFVKK